MKTNTGSGWRPLRREQLMQEVRHDAYKARGKLVEPTRCPKCGAVFQRGRWTWEVAPPDAEESICPACHRIADGFPAGYVTLSGTYLAAHRNDIVNLARNVEAHEKAEHALERIIAIDETPQGLLVTTTSIHLARAVGDAIAHANKGELEYHYNDEENLLRVSWARD